MLQKIKELLDMYKLKKKDENEVSTSYEEMRKSIIVERLKENSLFKTNLTSSWSVEKNVEEKEEQLFSKFRYEICSSKIIKYHCYITVDNETNNEEVTYIAIEPSVEDEEELKKIAIECNVSIEPIMFKGNRIKILASEYTGISEPQGKRVLNMLEDLDKLKNKFNA